MHGIIILYVVQDVMERLKSQRMLYVGNVDIRVSHQKT